MFTNKTKKNNSLACNTQQKFKSQLMSNGIRSFESASGLLRKTGSQLKQTKLSLCQKENKLVLSGFVAEPMKIKPKHEFVYVSANNQLDKNNYATKQNTQATKVPMKVEPLSALPTPPMSKPGRNLLSLVGRVDYCLKMHKMHPEVNAIWNVYGKLLRIIPGKSGEQTLLLRSDDKGPVLQAIYYDFQDKMMTLTNGCYVQVVGRFIGVNRLKTFKISQASNADWQQDFQRIENVTSYSLLHNNK